MTKCRVMIVEDSQVVRDFLRLIIERDPRLEVAAAVSSAEEALRLLDRVAPDVISMDIRLPGMNGFEATRRIMCARPTPIVVVAASVESQDLRISMNALRAGALAVVEKPVGTAHRDYEARAEQICTQLAIMSQVKVVRQRWNGGPGAPSLLGENLIVPRSRTRPDLGPFHALGIAASTGGPGALVQLLTGLGTAFPLPIMLVQHIGESFLKGFASWLRRVCPFPVVISTDREVPAPGTVYIAAAGHHLSAERGCLHQEGGGPVCGQRPSGTVLLRSLARAYGCRAIGVVLTGMGEDGAEGLAEIRKAGGYTIAEHESTAVVYGMPAAAVRIGAVCETLPLPEIAPRLRQLAAGGDRS